VQWYGELHESPYSTLEFSWGGSGVAWIVHLMPFQNSASTRFAVADSYIPTAVQLVSDAHEIPFSSLCDAPGFAGVAWIAHLLPFQCSASVLESDFR
jgi:hypothetical protein